MADVADAPVSTKSETILLMFQGDRDRELLDDWLSSQSGYRVVTDVDPDDPTAYDLALCDRASLDRYAELFRDHVERVAPVYLPIVLAASNGTSARERLPEGLDALADDVIELPVDQTALSRRLENLLKARRASKRLANREQQYQRLVELTPEAILLVRDGVILFANAAAADLFGVSEDTSLEGESLVSFVADDGRAVMADALDEVAREGSLAEYVTCEFGPDRAVGRVSGVRVSHGDGEATQLVVRDVTAEQARRERLDLFGRAIDAAAQGITIADARRPDEPLIYANESFDRITGYSVAEVLGRNCRFLQGENTNEETVARIRRAVDAGEAVAVEVLNYRKDGTPFWNELEIVPIEDESGTVTHFLGLQKDVTQRREREEQLAVLTRVFRHNVRNRLNVIEGYAQAADPAVRDRIVAASQDLLDIGDRLREFRRLSLQETDTLEETALCPTLERVVSGVREGYPEATLPLVCPDERRVRSHPLLFSSLQEVIESGLADDPGARIGIEVRPENGTVCVIVADHDGTIPTGNLAALESGAEDPLEHPRGIELWLLRWVTFHTEGDFAVDPDAEPPQIRLRLPTPE